MIVAQDEIDRIIEQFAAKGCTALHGGRKGNGFWIYDANNVCVQNDGKRSGNKKFWMMDDAREFLSRA
jgi:hypothetical protein